MVNGTSYRENKRIQEIMCEESIAKSFLNLIKDIIVQIQEVQYTQNKLNERNHTTQANNIAENHRQALKAFQSEERVRGKLLQNDQH